MNISRKLVSYNIVRNQGASSMFLASRLSWKKCVSSVGFRAFSSCNSCCSKNITTPTGPCTIKGKSSPECPKCWSCPHQLVGHSSLFCKSCGVQQPPVKQDHYALFAIPVSFDVDLKKLEAAFHALQIKLHPDIFGCKTETEQKFSLAHAANINTSYTTLLDPLTRSRYLLSLIDEQLVNDDQTATNTAALFEIMEYQELVEDTNDNDELINIFQTICQKKDDIVTELSQAHLHNNVPEAVDLTNQLSYIYTLKRILLEKIPGDVFSRHGICPIL